MKIFKKEHTLKCMDDDNTLRTRAMGIKDEKKKNEGQEITSVLEERVQ